MPRIRGIKQLVFYKPDRKAKYDHINSLFTEAINWELIERHYPDMLRVAISIKAGRITPSMILRRLGVASRKNKLYFAFRELGRAIRKIGRASCRERVCQYVSISVVAVASKNKN